MTRPMPPGGAAPPTRARTAAGDTIDLLPLAEEICRRYEAEFPDERERYGPAGAAWCVHDNLHLLAWAIQEARDGTLDLGEQVAWLATVLRSRGFPVARLARDLLLAAEVVAERLPDEALTWDVAATLTAAAARVCSSSVRT